MKMLEHSLLSSRPNLQVLIFDIRQLFNSQGKAEEDKEESFKNWLKEFTKAVNNERSYNLDRQTLFNTPPYWVFDHPEFDAWLKATERVKLLWLSGTTGFGKSVLAAYLTEELAKRSSSRIGYFFCKESVLLQEVHQIVRTFLYQITTQNSEARTLIRGVWQQSESIADLTASVSELFAALFLPSLRCLSENVEEVFLLIDGLNECPKDRIEKILQFLNLVKSISEEDSQIPRLRILLTCQRTPEISHALQQTPQVALQSIDNQENVKEYVVKKMGNLDRNSKLMRGFAMAKEPDPVEYFVNRHNGMFQWVSTMFKCLESMDPEEFEEFLNSSIPNDIDGLYRRVLKQLEKNLETPDLKWVKEVISWTTIATRNLTISELRYATMLSLKARSGHEIELPALEQTLSKCGAFLNVPSGVPEDEATVCLVHETFKKFVTNQEKAPPSFYVESENTNSYITMACLSYLSTQTLELPATFTDSTSLANVFQREHALFRYASWSWTTHLRGAHIVGPDLRDRVKASLVQFFARDVLLRWIRSVLAFAFSWENAAATHTRVYSTIDDAATWIKSQRLLVVVNNGTFDVKSGELSLATVEMESTEKLFKSLGL